MITGKFPFRCMACGRWFDAPETDEPITVTCTNCGAEYNIQFVPSERKKLIHRLEIIHDNPTDQYTSHIR